MEGKSNEDMNSQDDGQEGVTDYEINKTLIREKQSEMRIVLPGDHIGEGFISGHGTYENKKDGQIYANMAGVVHQIDRVICVRSLR